MNITYNITTLIGSAKTNGLAYFTAWYNSICAALGITPIATPGDFFAPSTSGDYVDFGAFLTSTRQIRLTGATRERSKSLARASNSSPAIMCW